MSKIIPMAGFVLVEDQVDELASGFVVAKEEKSQSQVGEVIGVPEKRELPDSLSELLTLTLDDLKVDDISKVAVKGTKIIYKKYGGNEVELDSKKYRLVSFSEIIGIIK